MSDHIQIGDISPRVQHIGDGTQTVFTYPFPIFKEADLEVYADGELQTLSTNYDITGAGASAGGEVTFVVAPADTVPVTLVRRLAIQRTSDFQASGEFRAKVINDELDFQTASLQQIEDDLSRAIRLKRNDGAATLELPLAAIRANKLIGFDADGNVTISTQSLSDLEGSAVAALAAQVAQTAAETARTGAEVAETNAETSQTAAEAAMVAAEAAAEGVIYNNVTYVSNANSPYTVNVDQDGELLSVDTSGGPVTINLPSIAATGDGWRISAKKATGDGNAITVTRNGTDTIDGAMSDSISSAASGATYIADTDGAPDDWTSVGFGAAAGNMSDDRFVAGVDYTKNSSTSLSLSGSPGTKANIWVSFDGVWQHPDDYSLSGSVLTLSAAIPADEVFVKYGATVPVGTPADGSVGAAQLANNAVGMAAVDTSVIATKTRDVNAQTGTSYTLALSDTGDIVTMNNGSANTLTIPTNASVAFANGAQIDVIQLGAGVTTIDAASSVTLNGVSGGSSALDARYKAATLVKLSTDTWNLVGAVGDVV